MVLLSFPVILLVFRDSGFRLLRKIQWIDLFIDEFRIRSDVWILSASVPVLSELISSRILLTQEPPPRYATGFILKRKSMLFVLRFHDSDHLVQNTFRVILG